MSLVPALGLLAIVTSTVSAQQRDSLPPIDTDRPDFTDGVHTIARGHIELETGYTYQQGRGADGGHSHSIPEALMRVGLTRRLELRVGENYLVQRTGGVNVASVHGFDDTYLGTKVTVTEQHGIVPALSLELKANLPTGSDAISAHRVLPGGALLLGWETPGPWSAGIEGFVTRTAAARGQAIGSLSVQYQVTSRAQVYGEVFTLQPVNGGIGAGGEHYANSGVLLLLSNDMQIDARIGVGLNHSADQYFVGFGFAVRR